MATFHKASSQYLDTKVVDFYLDLWNPREIPSSVEDKIVKIDPKYHERPDLMAFDMYGSPNYWWVFSVVNKDKILDPIYDFVSGLEITVPALKSVEGID